MCRAAGKQNKGKRQREEEELEISDVSNDENDPARANQAISSRQQRRKQTYGDDLTSSALEIVKNVIQSMTQIRGWTGSATVSALQDQAEKAGHRFSERLLVKVNPHWLTNLLLVCLTKIMVACGQPTNRIRDSALWPDDCYFKKDMIVRCKAALNSTAEILWLAHASIP